MNIDTIKALVRPLIAYSLTACFLWLAITGVITGAVFVGVFGPVVGYYFGQRDANKKPQ